MTLEKCIFVSKQTLKQSESHLWFELRYGRITASIIYEASQCISQMGPLVEKILRNKNIDSLAMNRGRRLGSSVLFKVSQMLRNKYGETEIKKSSLLLTKKYPLLGASPDGVTSRAV